MPEFGETLSERELEVLAAVIDGSTNKQIATNLFISQNTVKVHLRNIYTKLGVSTRTEAATIAWQQGLVSLDENGPGAAESALEAESPDGQSPPASAAPDRLLLEDIAGPNTIREATAFWSHWRTWLLLGAILLLLIALGAVFVQNRSQVGENGPDATERTVVPFAEIELADNWRQSRDMPQKAAGMALAAVGLNVYQIGGETSVGVSDAVWMFETTSGSWLPRATKPTAVAETNAVELFGELFVAGGRMVDGKATNVVEVYSPANDAWRTVPPLPIPVYGAAMVTDGSFLYLFGGADGQELYATGYKFDPAGNGWQPIASLPGARANATAGVIAGKLYVVGGRDDQGALDACAYYQPQEDSWHDCAPMLNPRAGAGTAVLVNKLYVVGGGLAGETIIHSEAYDPNTDTWSLVNTPMLAEIPQWTSLGVTNVETKIYTIGGLRGESGLSNKTYVYTPFVYTTYIPAASNNGP